MDAAEQNRWADLTFGADTRESRARLGELVLYIAAKCRNHRKFGLTKLNKILFYADFISFAKYGESITNTPYRKRPFGPVPDTLDDVTADMEAEKKIAVVPDGLPPYDQKRVVPIEEANIDEYFRPRDIALVDEVIQTLSDLSAREVSELSHEFAWHIAGDYELIPYDAVFIYDRELTEREVARARELAAKYDWDV